MKSIKINNHKNNNTQLKSWVLLLKNRETTMGGLFCQLFRGIDVYLS